MGSSFSIGLGGETCFDYFSTTSCYNSFSSTGLDVGTCSNCSSTLI
jgi:hypothetical protein